jgi:TPR repeat protein
LFAKACGISAQSCYHLGLATERGDGLPRDPAQARVHYDKACGAGTLEACVNLAALKMRGEGGAKDEAGARALYEQACHGGLVASCSALDAGRP